MLDGLFFGWRTAILVPPMAAMLLVAAGLTRPLINRTANRTLAVLLVVLAGVLTPWAIGFAGFYDRWQWLSFAPFAHPLAAAPLFYFYLHALVYGRLPGGVKRHLAAPLAYAAVVTVSFLLPMQAKTVWASITSGGFDVVVAIGILAGFFYYGRLSWRLLHDYRAWLASERSDDDRFAARWLQAILIGAAILLAVWSVYQLSDTLIGLSYSGLMGLYIVIAILGTALAVEGWRHAHLPFPAMPMARIAVPTADGSKNAPADQTIGETARETGGQQPQTESVSESVSETETESDRAAQADLWAAKIRAERLFQDPEISLASAARYLGTNQSYLSRAVNDGLGVNWSTFINGMRSEAVAERLRADPSADILGIALECGFNSKASFNRFFKAHHGVTPSAFRRKTYQNT